MMEEENELEMEESSWFISLQMRKNKNEKRSSFTSKLFISYNKERQEEKPWELQFTVKTTSKKNIITFLCRNILLCFNILNSSLKNFKVHLNC